MLGDGDEEVRARADEQELSSLDTYPRSPAPR